MDIDELLNFINNPSAEATTKPNESKKKKKNKTTPTVKNETPNTLDEIKIQKEEVKTIEPEIIESNKDEINLEKISLTEKSSILLDTNPDDKSQDKTITEQNLDVIPEGEEKKKKKKKKNKKKKNPQEKDDEDEEEKDELQRENIYRKLFDFSSKEITESRFQDNSIFRVIKDWQEKPWKQTNFPTKSIDEQFPTGEDYPVGEIIEYGTKSTSQEKKEQERLINFDITSLRKAAECHRQVRKFAQQIIRPGQKLIDICNQIENMNRFLINKNDLKCGIAFPTGCSLNHVAAHYTPNPGDFRTIGYNDVCKIDFGTHVNGYIIDCAFTVAFNPEYDQLLLAVQDATNTGLKAAGIDVRLCDVGEAIQEVMESYEVVINGKTHQVKSVKNLCGHTIEPYKIHAGKSVPIIKNNDYTKMEEGELYAIETFGSTGKGYVYEDSDCSHYMKEYKAPVSTKFRSEKAKALFNHINKQYSTLAFCRKWLEEDGHTNHALALRQLVDSGHINTYPPLTDNPGCYVAQFEHTVLMKPTCKEVMSRGDDY